MKCISETDVRSMEMNMDSYTNGKIITQILDLFEIIFP